MSFAFSSVIGAIALASAPAIGARPLLDEHYQAGIDLAVIALAADAALAQMTIERRVIIRVPLVPRVAVAQQAGPASPSAVNAREVAGPRCLALASIGGALINSNAGITLVAAQQYFRADVTRSCRSADFYAGFYLTPSPDGALCARRDSLHARSGVTCRIERFRRLVPRR